MSQLSTNDLRHDTGPAESEAPDEIEGSWERETSFDRDLFSSAVVGLCILGGIAVSIFSLFGPLPCIAFLGALWVMWLWVTA